SARCGCSGRPPPCRARPPPCARRPQTSASTPTRSWASSASPRRTSRSSARTRSCRDMAERLPTAEVAALLASTVAAIRAERAALPPAVTTFHPGEAEWSINEVIGHIIEAERRGFAGRIRTLITAKDPQLEGWDQNEVARGRRDDMKPAAKLVAALERI